jgi:hypothetical protein
MSTTAPAARSQRGGKVGGANCVGDVTAKHSVCLKQSRWLSTGVTTAATTKELHPGGGEFGCV